MQNKGAKKGFLSVRELVLFPLFGTLMFCSKIVMEALPNIHLLGMFTMVFTLVFRKKALIPIYIFVFLTVLYAGFTPWVAPYLYAWTVLWGVTMLLPKRMPGRVKYVVYPLICALHGLSFGVLCAPCQALFFGLNFKGTLAWIAAGLPFDITHAVGNLLAGILVMPLSKLLQKITQKQ